MPGIMSEYVLHNLQRGLWKSALLICTERLPSSSKNAQGFLTMFQITSDLALVFTGATHQALVSPAVDLLCSWRFKTGATHKALASPAINLLTILKV